MIPYMKKFKKIHPTAQIGKNVIIECNHFELGANSIIKDNCIINVIFLKQMKAYICVKVLK